MARDKGFALVGALVLTAGLLSVVSGLLALGNVSTRRTALEHHRNQALYAAESGINHALAVLRNGASLPDSEPPEEGRLIPDGPPAIANPEGERPHYAVWLFRDSSDGKRHIVAQGGEATVLRSVSVVVGAGSVFPAGRSEGQPPFPIAWESCGGGTVLPVASHGETEIAEPGAYLVDGPLELKSWSKLRVTAAGDVRVCAPSLVLGSHSSIEIGPSASVSFWVTGSMTDNAQSTIADKGSIEDDAATWPRFFIRGPLNLKAQTIGGGTSQRPILFFMDPDHSGAVTMYAHSELHGGIWAPTRKVELKAKSRVVGAVVGGQIRADETAISWLEAMQRVTLPGSETGITVSGYSAR